MFTWNEYLFALTFSQSAASKTVSVGISDFVGDVFVRWNLISAAGIITTIPALIFVFVFQKYIVQGLTSGSVKG
jgi:multiple sugar transport system permease protein